MGFGIGGGRSTANSHMAWCGGQVNASERNDAARLVPGSGTNASVAPKGSSKAVASSTPVAVAGPWLTTDKV